MDYVGREIRGKLVHGVEISIYSRKAGSGSYERQSSMANKVENFILNLCRTVR